MKRKTPNLTSVHEYFSLCEFREGRYEFLNGEILEMPAVTIAAGQIAGNIHRYIRGFLEDEPFIFVQGAIKLEVQEGKIFRIPDFLVFKEAGNKRKYATEPVLIVEVLSESTAKTDRFTKLNEYRSIPSLQYYLIVEQISCSVEMYVREDERWYVEFYDQMTDIISLPFFEIELPLSQVYKKIDFQPE